MDGTNPTRQQGTLNVPKRQRGLRVVTHKSLWHALGAIAT
jgi:hypothetical protein